ncbi:MAG: dihydropteroate synthase [Bacteroidales bacterium]|nr:dihydropteroate synthase [Bacteroidales bacterium]
MTTKHKTINCSGKIIDLSEPKVMGIVNVTPDSFYSGSRCQSENEVVERVKKHLSEGATFIDLGAYSTRPGCEDISAEEEINRLKPALDIITKEFPQALISIDTFRSQVAEFAISEYGVPIINDISGGMLDEKMSEIVGKYHAAYILMHMIGTPQNMQSNCNYNNLIEDITKFFAVQSEKFRKAGTNDIILDPGFGFSKTLDQNYELMNKMQDFEIFGLPILVGISRKSMIYKLLGGTPADSANGTTVLNTIALLKGADILRVHDVKPAVEAIKICEKTISKS